MRLIQCSLNSENDSISVQLTEYDSSNIPLYAILSHRWRANEVMYEDLTGNPDYKSMKGYSKIEGCARAALQYGINHIWIDTCCIIKSSSAELSEAINSMYSWYNNSLICIAFLDDVRSNGGIVDLGQFRNSTWFTRAWTLQELIAPKTVMFYSREWTKLGSRVDLANTISVTSGVDIKILHNTRHLDSASVAEKMSWAASREATRAEDIAYSLMGLFNVSMPTLYGEGMHAFRRLQLEIMHASNDHSLFAWQDSECSGGMLADSPSQFRGCHRFHPLSYTEFITRFGISEPKPDFTMTNAGLHIQLPMSPLKDHPNCYVAFLACLDVNPVNRIFAKVYLQRTDGGDAFSGFYRVAIDGKTVDSEINPMSRNVTTQTIWIAPKRARVTLRREEEFVPSRIITMETGQASKRNSLQNFMGSVKRRSTIRLGLGSSRKK